MKNIVICLTLLLLTCGAVQAQKIVIKSGSLDPIKSEKFFNITYDYNDVSVGKFENEEDYINKKVSEYNTKEPGRGDRWKEAWIGDRKARYQVSFEELLNKTLESNEIYVGEENTDSKYTMVLKTTFIEPGFNIYITKKPAMIHVIFKVVETANPSNVICEIISKNNPGRTFGDSDLDTGIRIKEAYAKCGKELGKFMIKKIYK
ncbi:hypothetical protein [Plebeiibacterium marinum]|uniref:DUF4468 domain-containing protein n=1 Tax=Plebeiibacterium marinum TaxID=2992111 RepID=A0AAE3MCA0_9BACT|nr:hypothetical protein [Plebeiobacterium marinum]MCW3805093.1 hypothetical protein [Plebeiobacterium marinum]